MLIQEYNQAFSPPYWGGEVGGASGEPMAQLLEAFMIAQAQNEKAIPLYGVEVVGKQWTFVIMEGKEYCISPSYDCLKRDDLMQIIAILRKFREILETRLLKM